MTPTIRNCKKLRFAVIALCVALTLAALTPATASAAGSVLKLGSSGSAVTTLQERLIALGYLDYPAATGYYGALTQTAVTRFQINHGLAADGIAGSNTQSALYASTAKSMVLRYGSSGEAVKALQLRLKELGFFGGTGTGYYGDVTRAAVVSFQTANGLTADGVAGPITHNRAFSGNASTAGAAAQAAPAASAAAIAEIALGQVGKPYALGTQGPETFDCSGLAYYAMTQAGFSVTRMSAAAYFTNSAWASVGGIASLQKGDLIFFRSETSSSITHMGIYIGDNQFVHASSGQAKVMVSTLTTYWTNLYMGARRVR
jgi:peptidoglycan hydrolase-like protein with peptidoglycan-binding domain